MVCGVTRAFEISTLASEENLLELRKNAGSFSDNSLEFDEGVEVDVAKFTEFVFDRQTADADEDLFVDEMVLRVHFVH